MQRFLAAQLMQETNSFSPMLTTLADFRAMLLLEDEAIIRSTLAGARQEMGGFLAFGEERGVAVVPVLAANACSAGPLTRETFDYLQQRLLDGIKAALPAEGILLGLHGAMVVEDEPDAEGAIVEAVRALVGPDMPITASLDSHANVTARMVKHADALCGYWTYPHVDMFEAAQRAADIAWRIRNGQVRPAMAMCKLPMIVPAENMQTTHGPGQELIDVAQHLHARPDIADASVFNVQPWLNIPEMGCCSVVVAANGILETAAAEALWLGRMQWKLRGEFEIALTPIEDALDRALGATGRPVVLADSADSTGSGSPGDSTAILKALLARQVEETCLITVVDPEAAAELFAAGLGADVNLRVGGKRDRTYNSPADVQGTVVHLAEDGRFTFKGNVLTGVESSMGRTAVLRAGGVHIVITEQPAFTVDPELYRSVGLEPLEAKMVFVKSPNLFRANYGRVAADIIMVDAPGLSSGNLRAVPYQHIERPMYPLDEEWAKFPGKIVTKR
jgi:microcystin degradation protein MlrC